MKLLQNKTNVTAPNATYAFGTMKDDTGVGDGSLADTEFMTDYVQFFEKLFNASGLTANGLPDNDANGYQLYEALRVIIPTREKIINIGDWDMDATDFVNVAHGLSIASIRSWSVTIISDSSGTFRNLTEAGFLSIGSTNVNLNRDFGGVFDSTGYDSTSFNRGYISIRYVD